MPFLQADVMDIWGLSTSDIWIVGVKGYIAHYDGVSFTQTASGTNEHLYGVWSSSATDVWAVGDNGTILHTE